MVKPVITWEVFESFEDFFFLFDLRVFFHRDYCFRFTSKRSRTPLLNLKEFPTPKTQVNGSLQRGKNQNNAKVPLLEPFQSQEKESAEILPLSNPRALVKEK